MSGRRLRYRGRQILFGKSRNGGRVFRKGNKTKGEKINDNSFSKGEKQLLAFARAIAKETSIYVFDEPTSNVDVESEIQLKKVIDNLSKDSTVIIIAHRPATIENVDKVLKVENGKVI